MVRAPRGPHPGERKRGWGGGKPAGGWGNGVSPSRRLRRNRFPDNGNVFWHFFQTMEACFGTFGPLRVAVAPLVAFPVEKFNLRERTAPFWLVLSLRFARQWKHVLRGRETAVDAATAGTPLLHRAGAKKAVAPAMGHSGSSVLRPLASARVQPKRLQKRRTALELRCGNREHVVHGAGATAKIEHRGQRPREVGLGGTDGLG